MLSPRPVGQKETIKSSYICEFLNKIQKKYNKYQDWFKKQNSEEIFQVWR